MELSAAMRHAVVITVLPLTGFGLIDNTPPVISVLYNASPSTDSQLAKGLLHFSPAESSLLGTPCTSAKACSAEHSRCYGGICGCQPYYVKYGDNSCLKSTLLGDDCLLSEQCSTKVANSSCVQGQCECNSGYLKFRKHTCLTPAKPGDICYSSAHCQLHAQNSYCAYTIANLFGVCHCDGDETLLDVNCDPLKDDPTEEFTTTELYEPDDSYDSGFTDEADETNKQEDAFVPQRLSTTETYTEFIAQETTEIPPQQTSETASKLNEETLYNNAVRLTVQNQHQQLRKESPVEAKYREEFRYPLGNPNFVKLHRLEDKTDFKPIPLKRGGVLVGKPISTLEESDAISLGLMCNSTEQCRKADQFSVCKEGICDCAVQNSSDSCSRSNTGCHPGTFQCRRSGVCLSWFFVCDGRRDCADGSDEECDGTACPPLSYQCGNHGKCFSRSVVCDGKKNCPDGEDESDCSPAVRKTTSCPEHSFRCSNGQCIPLYEFCNAIATCEDGSDEPTERCREHKLPAQFAKDEFCPFKCNNGRCRSTAIVCSGRDGCGDNSDEANCSVCRCPAP